MRIGIVESVHELRSITVGTIRGNGHALTTLAKQVARCVRAEYDVRALSLRRPVDGSRCEAAVEGLADDDGQHRAVRELGLISLASGLTSADAKRFATFCAASRDPR